MIALLLATVAAASSTCVFVTGERIYARDLAAVVPEFSALAPDLSLGYAPRPGLQRVFEADELGAILTRHGLSGEVANGPVCAEWKMAALEPDSLRNRAAQLLAVSPSLVEVVDWSRHPVPAASELVLEADDLRSLPNSENVAMWKGFARYGGNRRMEIWLKIRLSVEYTRVVALANVRAGERLDAAQLRLESRTGIPDPQAAKSLEEVAGKVAKRSFAAGSPILLQALAEAKAVLRGDTVQVEVRCGAARLRFDGVAQGAAAVGQTVAIKNNETAKIVRARVEAPGVAVLMLPGTNGDL